MGQTSKDIGCDVIFDENNYGLEKEQFEKGEKADKLIEIDLPDDELQISESTDEVITEDQERDESVEDEVVLRRSNRERRSPDHYGEWINSAQTEHCPEPITYEEALTSSEKDKWMEAMNKEMVSLKTNDVYDLVELPKDRKAVGSKWVYKRKSRQMDQWKDIRQD